MRFILPIQNFSEPCKFVDETFVIRLDLFAFFICPMGRNSVFSNFMHFLCPNLDLQWIAFRSNDSCMKGLIEIWFRHCDIVFEPSGHRFPIRMDDSRSEEQTAELKSRFEIVY